METHEIALNFHNKHGVWRHKERHITTIYRYYSAAQQVLAKSGLIRIFLLDMMSKAPS